MRETNFALRNSKKSIEKAPIVSGAALNVKSMVHSMTLTPVEVKLEKPTLIVRSPEFEKKLDLVRNLNLVSPLALSPSRGPLHSNEEMLTSSQLLMGTDGEDDEVKDLPFATALLNPEHSGMLSKRGNGIFNSQYKERYCVLKNSTLFWLKNKSDEVPAGKIILKPSVSFALLDDRTLEIITPIKTYVFQSANNADMDIWHYMLKKHQIGANGDVFFTRVQLLRNGEFFTKYKNSSIGKRRLIWCSPEADRLFWGDEHRNIRGEILLADIIRIDEGCPHACVQENAFEIVTESRTLELESSSLVIKNALIEAIITVMESL